ncbi:protein translocase subunit SecF [Gordonia phthalatica]|uniref:Protein-export membrane protein SecF n=1 Tax=Gordonia phthalatica TaxID=1136941 RepID=A0A0N7FUL8_9ACTN|nr:protein translocase subunit SecF [Gordonia phthalatica]ALG84719.1 preprotein translocase subunit SecF [Gordonia phthalatica]
MSEPTIDDKKATTEWSDADYVADNNHSFLSRLYSGTGAFDVIGKRRMWYVISGVMMVICILSIAIRGFTFGIDFEGGTQISMPARGSITTSDVSRVFEDTLHRAPETVQAAGAGDAATFQIRTETLSREETGNLLHALGTAFQPEVMPGDVSSSDVSSTWGQEITRKMLIALVVFLIVAFIYIAIRFDKEMSVAAMASLVFDLVVTAGIYSLVGWEMTPATVIGLLTILGFSVYDTVVVFDKVEENTRSVLVTTRRTYAEQTNLAVNQTLMRSINTTVISVLPIIALMVVAVWMLGVGTLKDLALIQLVGVVVGTYSSVFLASPWLVSMKERNKDIKRHNAKVMARRERASA